MAVTDLTGTTWTFNDTIDISSDFFYYLTFIVPNADNLSCISLYSDTGRNGRILRYTRSSDDVAYGAYLASSGWHASYQIITITGGDDVTNATLISWLEANATQQSIVSRKSIDLTTLAGWEALSSGTHKITIVAKADGYRDSEPSAAVSVTKTDSITPYITFTGESSDFTLTATNKEWDGTVEYSTDTTTWTVWDGSEISSSGQKLYLRGSGNTKFFTSNGAKFVLSALAGCSGNLNTLLQYDNPPTAIASYCYRNMFYDCTNLTTAPELPATTLTNRCYDAMFYGCTSLTQAPELPATTLAASCYEEMFYHCTSLTTAPELPATTLTNGCYQRMFTGCTNLIAAPNLPATTLEDLCYAYMFSGCTNLITAPDLPATTSMKNNCYSNMFKNCTSLTTAPALPATRLAPACYASMFDGCTSLTTAPALPATRLENLCYSGMFQNCTSLTTAPALPATTLTLRCYQYMFYGCTSLTSAPELPATTLRDYCYSNMFSSCTSLTSLPELPATTLRPSCYQAMFNECGSIKVSNTQSDEYPTAWRIPSNGTISSTATKWNTNMLYGTGGTFTSDPSINTTYYGAW